jgi:hypothetical protein
MVVPVIPARAVRREEGDDIREVVGLADSLQRLHVARHRPRDPPVTSAVLLLRSNMMLSVGYDLTVG